MINFIIVVCLISIIGCMSAVFYVIFKKDKNTIDPTLTPNNQTQMEIGTGYLLTSYDSTGLYLSNNKVKLGETVSKYEMDLVKFDGKGLGSIINVRKVKLIVEIMEGD